MKVINYSGVNNYAYASQQKNKPAFLGTGNEEFMRLLPKTEFPPGGDLDTFDRINDVDTHKITKEGEESLRRHEQKAHEFYKEMLGTIITRLEKYKKNPYRIK